MSHGENRKRAQRVKSKFPNGLRAFLHPKAKDVSAKSGLASANETKQRTLESLFFKIPQILVLSPMQHNTVSSLILPSLGSPQNPLQLRLERMSHPLAADRNRV